jgi:hypothetical protein
MATTTPNYGWVVPTSTDLVKDGATAIETLGDSADATLKALNPATTLGDIQYRSATANTNTRLGIGSTGNLLTVSGGVPVWAAPPSSGSFTKITSAAFSAQSSIAVDDCFTSTYTKYFIMWRALASVSNADLQFQLRYAGPSTQVTSYSGAGFSYNRENTFASWGYTSQAQNTICPTLATGTSFGNIYIDNVGNSSAKPTFYGQGFSDSYQQVLQYSGWVDSARTYTGFLIKADSGTMDGNYAVYGLAN